MEQKKDRKMFYSMGEVAEMFDVNASMIRYWENKFDILKPHKNKKGNRMFTPADVDNLKVIYHLVKEKGMTLEGAARMIRERREGVIRDMEVIERLMSMRSMLQEIRQELGPVGGVAIAADDWNEEQDGDEISTQEDFATQDDFAMQDDLYLQEDSNSQEGNYQQEDTCLQEDFAVHREELPKMYDVTSELARSDMFRNDALERSLENIMDTPLVEVEYVELLSVELEEEAVTAAEIKEVLAELESENRSANGAEGLERTERSDHEAGKDEAGKDEAGNDDRPSVIEQTLF